MSYHVHTKFCLIERDGHNVSIVVYLSWCHTTIVTVDFLAFYIWPYSVFKLFGPTFFSLYPFSLFLFLTSINMSMCLMLFVETNIVQPVHLDMNPPIPQAAEQDIVEVVSRVNRVIQQLMKKSSVVIHLVQQLSPDINKYDRSDIQEQLRREIKKALKQNGIATEVARKFAIHHAYIIVRSVRIGLVKRGNSIVVYYICETIKAFCYLGQMITSGFLREVFSAIIQSLASTTVDVILRANDYNLRLLCLSSTHGKGLYLDRELFN